MSQPVALAAQAPIEPSSEVIKSTIRTGIEEIGHFVVTTEFQQLLEELYEKPNDDRPQFVTDVVLNSEERAQRGITVPDGIHILRSAFADGRPSLFCVSKIIPLAAPWHRVTITFDNDLADRSKAGFA
jgi:hypothetical protein